MLIQYRKPVYITLVAVLIIAIAFAAYFSFFYTPKCANYECFKNHMAKCSKAIYVNDEPVASWGYEIKGISGSNCEIEITLLMAKEGELQITKYVGHTMDCSYPIGVTNYPEKDLSKCHGILREDLQTVIINKLHSYLIENLGKFDESLEKAI